MTAKEYLGQIKKLDSLIQQNLDEESRLRFEGQTLRSFDYTEDRVQSSPGNEAPFAATIEKIMELDEKINAQIDQLVDLRQKIAGEIRQLENPTYAVLLHKRYVECKNFDDIAEEMNYSYEWIRHLHALALDAFEKIMPDNT